MPNLVAIDWGTSSFRAYLVDAAGKVLQKTVAEKGILSVENGSFDHSLEVELRKFHWVLLSLRPACHLIS